MSSYLDTHDYDTAWGSTISEVKLDNGTQKKVVIGTDKRGDIMAMDATHWKTIVVDNCWNSI